MSLLQTATIAGQTATVVFLDAKFHPVAPDDPSAVAAKALFTDGSSTFYTVPARTTKAFDPAKHPHKPGGSPEGGEWAPTGGGGSAPADAERFSISSEQLSSELASNNRVMVHGSTRDLSQLQPGTMFSDDPVWAAGYTTHSDPISGREHFVGSIHVLEIPTGPTVEATTVHNAEGKLISMGRTALGREPRTLNEAATAVHEQTQAVAILARREGRVTGGILLVPVPVRDHADPVQALRHASRTGQRIPSNLDEALGHKEFDPAKHPHKPAGSPEGGEWAPTGGAGRGDDGVFNDPRDALHSLVEGERVDIQAGDVRKFLELARKYPGDPNLVKVHVEGYQIFGGKGLGIDRADMPQIPREHRASMLKAAQEHGIEVTRESVSPLTLSPTQDNISARRVGEKIRKYEKNPDKQFPALLVSGDGHVLDGHHHWGMMSALAVDIPNITVPIVRLHTSTPRALAELRSYARAHNIQNEGISGDAVDSTKAFNPNDDLEVEDWSVAFEKAVAMTHTPAASYTTDLQLEVKSVTGTSDDREMVLTGIASTPALDRQGHRLDPFGATFPKMIPLLFQHDQTQPIGTAELGTPMATGIPFIARIPYVKTPGRLKDRIDEIRQALREGLYKAVSVGWRPLANGLKLAKDGLQILKSEILELSIVTVPANPDAAILSVKGLLTDSSQAAFRDATDPAHLAGVSAATRRDPRRLDSTMNASEQIVALQATRKATSERINELMGPVLRQEGELNDAQQTEYDNLGMKLKSLDRDIERFVVLEQANLQHLVDPVTGLKPKSVSGLSPFQHVSVAEQELPSGIGLARALICQARALKTHMAPWDIAKKFYPSHPSIETYLKAAVLSGTTTGEGGSPDSGWGSALAVQPTTLVSSFMEYLRPRTIIGRIPTLQRVPFNTRVQSQTSGGSAKWVGQAKAKPVTKFDYDAVTLGPAKVAAISVLADELMRFSNPSAEARVRDSLTRVIVERLDIDFIDPNKGLDANVSPASITNDLTPVTGSGGTDLASVDADVQALLGAFVDSNIDPTNLVWIMPATTALGLSLLRNEFGATAFPTVSVTGGTFMGFPVVASQYAAQVGSPAANVVILANASDIFVADDGGVTIDVSTQASIEMSDDPDNDTGSVVSMYQTNQVALRAERYINWARGRDSAVQYMAGVTWGAAGSPA